MSLKYEIYNLVDSGSDYREIISQVTKLIVEKALLTSRGNQTAASKLVKMSRGTLRQYVESIPRVSTPSVKKPRPVKLSLPWRESLGFAPVRRGRVQVRYDDGRTDVGKTRRFDWVLVKQWRPHK